MSGGRQQQQSIDLSVLSLEQLNQMKTQHEEEVQTLSGNFAKLRDAQVLYVHTYFSTRCVTAVYMPHVTAQPVSFQFGFESLGSGALDI